MTADEQELVEKMAKRWHGKYDWDNLTEAGKSNCYAQMNDLLSIVKEKYDLVPKLKIIRHVISDEELGITLKGKI